jgi:glycine/D-amino acid oxidase-like deaminating enzyme
LNSLVQPHDDIDVSIAAAKPLLEDRLVKLYPHLQETYQAYRVSSGIRLVTERTNLGRLPIVGKLSDRVWVLTGLGSRGLVYHALMAQYLTNAIINNDESLIPQPLQPRAHCPNVRS